MWDLDFVVEMISAIIATVSFAVLFRLRPKYLFWAAICGGGTYFIYYVVNEAFGFLFAAAFFASVFSAIYSEICARAVRAPAILFIFPGAISIVPGGSLYRTMINLISKDYAMAWKYLGDTMYVALGIAGGLIFVSLMFYIVAEVAAHLKREKQ